MARQPYRSRLLTWVTRQYHRWQTAGDRTQRWLQLNLLWGIQVILYPVYLLLRAGQRLRYPHQFGPAQKSTPTDSSIAPAPPSEIGAKKPRLPQWLEGLWDVVLYQFGPAQKSTPTDSSIIPAPRSEIDVKKPRLPQWLEGLWDVVLYQVGPAQKSTPANRSIPPASPSEMDVKKPRLPQWLEGFRDLVLYQFGPAQKSLPANRSIIPAPRSEIDVKKPRLPQWLEGFRDLVLWGQSSPVAIALRGSRQSALMLPGYLEVGEVVEGSSALAPTPLAPSPPKQHWFYDLLRWITGFPKRPLLLKSVAPPLPSQRPSPEAQGLIIPESACHSNLSFNTLDSPEPQGLTMPESAPTPPQSITLLNVSVETIGYIKHPLEHLLEKLDQILLWVETQWTRFLNWLAETYRRWRS